MPFKRPLTLLFFSIVLMACNLFSSSAVTPTATPAPTLQPSASPRASIDPRFQPILPALKAVNIPLRLLPSIEDYPKGSQNALYVTVLSAAANGYDLAITLQPDCSAHICIQGHLIGEVVTNNSVPGTPVALINNITGYYSPPVCGANCSDGQLGWIEHNIRYFITMRGDNVALLTRFANATLAIDQVNAHS